MKHWNRLSSEVVESPRRVDVAQFSGTLGSVRLTVGFYDLKDLFQP